MRPGGSSLNPFAASYVPISKRAGTDVNSHYKSEQELNRGNGASVWFRNQSENLYLPGIQHQNVSKNEGAMLADDFPKWKDPHGGKYRTSTSQHVNEMPEKSNFDDDMDMAYLQMTFPGISYESLHGVYLTNNCDLDAAVDMINQLEMHPIDSSNKLPDSLDIGDVPESDPMSYAAASSKKAVGASTSGHIR